MTTFRSFSAAIALAGVLAIPALAASPAIAPTPPAPPPSRAAAPAMPATATAATVTKGPAGTLQQTHGMWRSATLVGATVYNTSGQSVGEISNLLITSQGKVSMAVLSVGGFLGVDSKLVEVPFDALKFERSVNDRSATGAATPAATAAPAGAAVHPPAHAWTAAADYSVVLPNSSKAALTKMAVFTYRK